MRLPGIPERVDPHRREVEERARSDDPEAVPLPERSLEPELVLRQRAERTPVSKTAAIQQEETSRDEDAPHPLRPHAALAAVERAAEGEDGGTDSSERRGELAERRRPRDAIVDVIERPEEIHDPPGADDDEQRARAARPSGAARRSP